MTEIMICTPSARKSLGEFKPLLVYTIDGRTVRTEVCEKSDERAGHYTRQGYIRGNRYARGTTYATREEAVAAAKVFMDVRKAEAERRYAASEGIPGREDHLLRVQAEIRLWSGAN